MSQIGHSLGFPPETFLQSPDNRLVLPYCFVGLEFEFERVVRGLPTVEPWAHYWQHKRDNSLHDAGMEFVFRRPYFGADVIVALEGLLDFAREMRYAVSIRTGLHVHLDVRDLEMQQLINVCALYALFEKVVYRYIGDNREENVFCLPWFKAHGTVLKINDILNSKPETLRGTSASLNDEKYAGLNLDCLARFGSIEFRHALATQDPRRVLDWINICMRFKQAACTLKLNSSDYAAYVLSVGAAGLGRAVFQDQFSLLDYEHFERDVMEEGVPVMLDVVNSFVAGWSAPASIDTVGCFDRWAKDKKPTEKKTPEQQGYEDLARILNRERITRRPAARTRPAAPRPRGADIAPPTAATEPPQFISWDIQPHPEIGTEPQDDVNQDF